MGEGVTGIGFETGVVEAFSLSPEQYWEAVSTHSGLFIHRLENIDDDERPALEDEMIEAIEEFIEESRNAVEMEYRLTTATVT